MLAFFHYSAQEAKCLRTLREDSKGSKRPRKSLVKQSRSGPIEQSDPEFSESVLNRPYRIDGARFASQHVHYQPIMQFGISQDGDDLLLALRRSDGRYIQS
jgi:hypothetical protein